MEDPNQSQVQKIFIIGSINVDFFYSVQNLPRKGETLQMKLIHQALGGKGFNQAINIANFFKEEKNIPEMFFVGAVGDDGSGSEHLNGNFRNFFLKKIFCFFSPKIYFYLFLFLV